MVKRVYLIALLGVIFSFFSAQSATFSSVQTGDWNDASTWRAGAGAGGTAGVDFPSPTDNVFISNGDTVYIDFGTSGTLYEYEATLEIDTAGLLWVEVGDNNSGLALINNARIFNRGRLYAAKDNEGPGTVGPIEIDIYLEDNSIYYAFSNSFNYCADDIHIRDNAIFFVEINVCIEIDDDFHLQGANSILCGEGGASIGVSTADNDVIFELAASSNNICNGLTVFRGVGATCNPTSGIAVVTGTGPTNLRPRAVSDNFLAVEGTANNLNILYQGEDDIDLDGPSLEIISAGSNGAINNNLTNSGGSLSINNNGTPLNFTDDFLVYTPTIGFIGLDFFQYIIEDDDGATDTTLVNIEVSCGPQFITTSNFTYANFESETNDVVDELNAEGPPDGNFAQIYNNNEQLILDMGQIYSAGTQYQISWRMKNTLPTGGAPSIIDLSESTLPGSGFTNHPISPSNNNSVSFTKTTVTSNVDFRYLAFDKGNSSTVDFEIDAVGVISTVSCEADTDSDGISNVIDIDDDNDGILDGDEPSCAELDAYWSLDNSTNDFSGNGNNERSEGNAPSFSTDAIQGSHSANFNGTTNQIRYSQDGAFMESNYTQISFSAWIKPTNLIGDRIIYEEGGGTNGFMLWLDDGVATATSRSGGLASETDIASSVTLTVDNQWHHLAVTFNNGVISVYVDGISNSITAAYGSIPGHGSDGGIGGDFGSPNGVTGNFAGLMDAVKYSNTVAWTAAQIDVNCDSDGDGLVNNLDSDSDNDGISDLVESEGIDSDSDGRLDIFIDTDNDGLVDFFDSNNGGTTLIDSDQDGDGIPNRLDLDSDNDGITDNVEGQTTASFIAPSGEDSDGDGIDNSYDVDNGSPLALSNNDGAGSPDYLDLDSDDDGLFDWSEGFDDNNTQDALDDYLLRADAFETTAGFPMFYINANDTDGDGVPNWAEDDDADNLPNFLDPQSSFYQDTDLDGLIDLYDTDNGGLSSNTPDGDSDGEFDFRDLDNIISLPIELLYFDGDQREDLIELKWETLTEINNNYFTIEKFINGRFLEIAEVIGAGNSSTAIKYSTYDFKPNEGDNYYRLTQTDFDGSSVSTELINVIFKSEEQQIQFYPNPNAIGLIHIKANGLENQSNCALKIFNQFGQLVQQEILNIDDSALPITVHFNKNLSKGVYYFQIVSRDRIVKTTTVLLN